jgi:hypothetical protein
MKDRTREMLAFKKINDPNYFLNTDAVMNDINSAFTTEPSKKEEGKYKDLKARS